VQRPRARVEPRMHALQTPALQLFRALWDSRWHSISPAIGYRILCYHGFSIGDEYEVVPAPRLVLVGGSSSRNDSRSRFVPTRAASRAPARHALRIRQLTFGSHSRIPNPRRANGGGSILSTLSLAPPIPVMYAWHHRQPLVIPVPLDEILGAALALLLKDTAKVEVPS
jgi:hypothetical protein